MQEATTHSYLSGGGPTVRLEVKDENYVIVNRESEKVQGFGSVEISFKNHIIRVYDDRPWKIHHMNSNQQTIPFQTLTES